VSLAIIALTVAAPIDARLGVVTNDVLRLILVFAVVFALQRAAATRGRERDALPLTRVAHE
jgi:hypothetical protein